MSSQVLSPQASPALVVWVRLLRGHSGLTRELSAQLLEQHGLTINDYEVMMLLSEAEENRMRRVDLADEIQLSASGITRLLDGLQAQGYVERVSCPTDARVAWARLTAEGEAKLASAAASHQDSIRRAFDERYSAEELDRLAELLSRLPGAGHATCLSRTEAG